ncbi:hypothetical protein ES703_63147 [subsurface metagenome]
MYERFSTLGAEANQTAECAVHCHRRPERLGRLSGRPSRCKDAKPRPTCAKRSAFYKRPLLGPGLQSFASQPYDGNSAVNVRRLPQSPTLAKVAGTRRCHHTAPALYGQRLPRRWRRQNLPRPLPRPALLARVFPIPAKEQA